MLIPRSRRKTVAAVVLASLLGLVLTLHAWAGDTGARNTGVRYAAAQEEIAAAQSAGPQAIGDAPVATNCRFGVGFVPDFPIALSYIPILGAGWFANFSPYEPVEPHAEFVYTVRVRQVIDQGIRLPEFWVFPPLNYTYQDQGQTMPGLGWFVEQAPGATWMIGNEIEIDNDKQDNIMPDVYARAYHDTYHYIKSVDPTAKVAIGAMTMATPGRLQYLDIVWDTYEKLYGTTMPVDIWNIHIYILAERTRSSTPQYADGKIALGTDPELAIRSSGKSQALCPAPGSPDTPEYDPDAGVYCLSEHDSVRIFTEQVYALRRWMKDHGQQDKPLMISEYGSLFPYFDGRSDGTCKNRPDEFGQCMYPQRVSDFLDGTIQFMENTKDPELGFPADGHRLVQRWLWYSIVTEFLIGDSSNLLADDYLSYPPGSQEALSPIGRTFQNAANDADNTTNLSAGDAADVSVFVPTSADTGTAVLTASFRNDGALSVVKPFQVTFFADQALTRPIGTATIDPAETGPVAGCVWNGRSETASVEWSDLTVGKHGYWARIDSANQVGEASEADNVTTKGEVTVYPSSIVSFSQYLPLARGD